MTPQAGIYCAIVTGFLISALGAPTAGRTLLLCGALPQPAMLMNAAEFPRHAGAENILPHVEAR